MMVYAIYNPNPCANCGPEQDGKRICTGRCVPKPCDCDYCTQQRQTVEAREERRRELLKEHARLGISGH